MRLQCRAHRFECPPAELCEKATASLQQHAAPPAHLAISPPFGEISEPLPCCPCLAHPGRGKAVIVLSCHVGIRDRVDSPDLDTSDLDTSACCIVLLPCVVWTLAGRRAPVRLKFISTLAGRPGGHCARADGAL